MTNDIIVVKKRGMRTNGFSDETTGPLVEETPAAVFKRSTYLQKIIANPIIGTR